ncbi:MAG: DNA polymerase IV [Bdellovibrionales bacterium]|nr:DNA polymerase IV [Bdellovibrionales bacterium]
MQTKIIFHIDLDSFFVAVERLLNPALVGKKVAVGGSAGVGVISSASYEARKSGVRSAMPVSTAKRICPDLIIVPHHFKEYSEASKKIFGILRDFSPIIEAVSIDEGYLDMTGTEGLWGSATEAATKIRKRIQDETGLTASIGIGSNRLIAKVATDQCKPNGMLQIQPGREKDFLAPLPVKVLPGVGPQLEKILHSRAWFRISDLHRVSEEFLERETGGMGRYLKRASEGLGSIQFHRRSKRPSISRETTFSKNCFDAGLLERTIREFVQELCEELRQEEQLGVTLKLKLRFPDFTTLSRSRTFPFSTRNESFLVAEALQLFYQAWDGEQPIRLIGIGLALGEENVQTNLFDPDRPELGDPRKEKLSQLRDQVKSKFGKPLLKLGSE